MNKTGWLLVMAALMVALTGCSGEATVPPEATTPPETTPKVAPAGETPDIKTTPGGEKYIVDPAKIIGGGPPKDGIPSIDNPRYVTVAEADQWIADNELVLAIIYRGVTRVYPLQIMVWHEIVNDTIAGDPLLITY